MVAYTCQRFFRSLRSMCAPLTAVIGFSCLLTFLFILYQPTPGPGIIQRLGWQSWDEVTLSSPTSSKPNTSVDTQANPDHQSSSPSHDSGVDWWNVSTSDNNVVDSASLPLDQWTPLLPHDTGLSEITVVHCFVDPYFAPADLCQPSSTKEQDAINGKWVRVDRNLNFEAGYFAGYLSIFYRRTRRQDIALVTDIRLLTDGQEPFPLDGWTKASTSLRTGYRAPSLYLWYRTGKSVLEMTPEEKANIITELDVLFGDDTPWYGFEKLEPPTLPHLEGRTESTWITYRRGVKIPPQAPPLHFSRDGKFKILQIADLHFSVSMGDCRDVRFSPCEASDNLTSTLLGRMLDAEKPDLVVFSGDQLNGQGTSWDPKSVLAKFARAVTDRQIPWAAVFGNHDSEDGATREEQMQLMEALPYSLVEKGPRDIHGVGNYVLKVKSADPSMTHLLTLYFLDSNSYSKGTLDIFGLFKPTQYDWIHQDQIDWFLMESSKIDAIERPFTPDGAKDLGQIWKRQDQIVPQTRKLAKPNALMFFHIPLPEAYNPADRDPRTNKPLDMGIHDNERAGNAKGSDGFFEKALLSAMESENISHNMNMAHEVKVVANGHCHITENCRRVHGIWMCFGGGGSYSGYGKVGFDRRFRVYEISDFGETISTYKRTESDATLNRQVLAGNGAAPL